MLPCAERPVLILISQEAQNRVQRPSARWYSRTWSKGQLTQTRGRHHEQAVSEPNADPVGDVILEARQQSFARHYRPYPHGNDVDDETYGSLRFWNATGDDNRQPTVTQRGLLLIQLWFVQHDHRHLPIRWFVQHNHRHGRHVGFMQFLAFIRVIGLLGLLGLLRVIRVISFCL